MSTSPNFVGPPDQASLETSLNTSRSPKSIVTSLRHKTSRLFGRNITNNATVDNTPQPPQPDPPKRKRGWFHSVGSRFHRHDHVALGSSECSQEIQVVMEEAPQKTNPPSSTETTPPQSPMRRRLFRGRFRLYSLPARFRRRGVALFSRSPSLSDEDKENFVAMPGPTARSGEASNTGSWSSFRSGVQRAVREVVDGNFRFSEDRNQLHSGPPSRPSRPPPRVPLRTLWTIMSADSSEGQDQPQSQIAGDQNQDPNRGREYSPPPKRYQLSSPDWSPDWSPPPSPTCLFTSPSSRHNTEASSPGGLTHSGSTVDSMSVLTPHGLASPMSTASLNRGNNLDVTRGQMEQGAEEDGEGVSELLSGIDEGEGGGEGDGREGGERVGGRYGVERSGVGPLREEVRPRVVSSPAVVG